MKRRHRRFARSILARIKRLKTGRIGVSRTVRLDELRQNSKVIVTTEQKDKTVHELLALGT